MKISHLQEDSQYGQPNPTQPAFRSGRDPRVLEVSTPDSDSYGGPKFGRNPKELEETTTSGSVASVSTPVGATISRNASVYPGKSKGNMLKGIKTSKKYANSAPVNESHIPLNKIDPPDHGEPEGDFVKNQLHTIKRVTSHLERIVGNNEDLPEWVEMKISQAQGMMVAIMGYMVSSKERELERETGEEGIMAEDEQVDGMALGELKEIVKNAKHIYNSVKNGTPLDGWMYSYVTVSNDHLNSVAEQIDNPAIREPKGVVEGHADQQRKIFKKNGKPVGEVGIDRESSPGNGQWYMKCYAYNIDNAGYDSYEEAVEELKHCLKQGVAEGYQLDEGAMETISNLVKKLPGIGKYYQIAQQYKPQLVQILKTSKSGKEVKQKMEALLSQTSTPVAEAGWMKQLGGLALGGGSILSTMWMNAMGMIDGVLAHAAAGEVGGAVASGSILGLIPVTLMLFAAMLLFKGSKQSSDERAQAVQAQRGQQGVAEAAPDPKHLQRYGHEADQTWPDDSNSLSKRYNDRDIVVPNLDAVHAGTAPKNKHYQSTPFHPSGMKIATKIKPSITKTTVDRLDRDTTVPNFLKKKVDDITEVYDEDDECDYCRGTGEGQFDGTSCSHCHGTGVARPNHNDDDENFNIPDDYDSLREDHIDEDLLAKKLAQQLQLFKRGVDKELGTKPKAKDLGKKPVYTNTLESKSKHGLPGAVSGIKIMSPEEFVSSKGDEEVDEATKLPAQQRELGGKEFQDYMGRIKGTDDIDKKTGKVKIDKKGLPKYTSGKTKTDKYKMPYVHRSSAIEYLTPDGKSYSEDAIKKAILQRPKSLLKQNEKMKHSNGELEQFFNVGFAALTGIAVDESTDKLIIVNTCPGAGSCKVDCFAMKGGKIQFKAAWLSDARILTYLLNDPDGFFKQLSDEISKEEKLGDKGGYEVTIRWHDAGDFFSPEYQDLALKMADKHPGVKFYAYTKMADAVLAKKPGNFIINWSEGANTSQEKKVKAKDASLQTTKNSRIVPTSMFDDLLVKDEKGNLKKGSSGQWQIQHEKLPELKERLAKAYGISANSILSYREWEIRGKKNPSMKWNVIVAPGEPDLTANDSGVLSTLLLRH